MKKLISAVVLLVFILNVVGCATILKEKETQVKIDSEPQGATIYRLSGGMLGRHRDIKLGKTPATITFKNRNNVGLIFKKDGYEESTYEIRAELQNGWMVASFVCFIFPALVDLASGNAKTLKDKEVKVVLEPVTK